MLMLMEIAHQQWSSQDLWEEIPEIRAEIGGGGGGGAMHE